VLRLLRPDLKALFEDMRQRFHEQFADWLIEPLGDLEPDLVLALLGERSVPGRMPPAELGDMDRRDLLAFARGRRDFAAAQPALRRLAWTGLTHAAAGMEAPQAAALVLRVLQRRPEPEVVDALGLSGAAALVEHLRAACRHLLASSEAGGC
jgi:tRNA(Met) C34 N-acetyltransferase TmcA